MFRQNHCSFKFQQSNLKSFIQLKRCSKSTKLPFNSFNKKLTSKRLFSSEVEGNSFLFFFF